MEPNFKDALFYHIAQMESKQSDHSDDYITGWQDACDEFKRVLTTFISFHKELTNGGNPDHDKT